MPNNKSKLKQFVTIFLFFTLSASAKNRVANAKDAATIPNCNVGDYIIDVANGNPDIFLNTRIISIVWPAKILISADVPTSLGHDFGNITLNLNNCIGYDTTTHRGKITFYSTEGRRLVYRGYLRLYQARGWDVDATYDPVKKTGMAGYTGRDGNWPFIIGKYGICNDVKWSNTVTIGTVLDSNSYGIRFIGIEFSNGGFAPISINGLNNGVDFYRIRFTKCLVYNRNGEGSYVGSTQQDPQRSLIGLEFDDNIIVVTGNDGVQFDRLFWDINIHNNVIICGGANFRNAFEEYQDHGVQLTITGNNVRFRNNIVLGGGEMAIQVNYKADRSQKPGSAENRICNNVFYGARGPKGLYTGAFSYGTKARLVIDSNFWGHFALPYDYNKIVTGKPNTQIVINPAFSSSDVIVEIKNNKFDGTKTSYIVRNGTPGATLDTSKNSAALTPWPQFNNLFGFTFKKGDTIHPRQIEIYTEKVGEKWSRSTSDSNHHPAKYWPGWLVSDSSKWFMTKDTVSGLIHPGVSNGWENYYKRVYWDLNTGKMVFDPVSLKGLSEDPPLDLRLPADDPYAKLGIGLTDLANSSINKKKKPM
ncbi:MAG: hypothetical protein C5B52_03770 [Bacteroidetes bacterium]|nr:MAG: hypothetical protein C5B52_03770 [Bacteroidota bacterium]